MKDMSDFWGDVTRYFILSVKVITRTGQISIVVLLVFKGIPTCCGCYS